MCSYIKTQSRDECLPHFSATNKDEVRLQAKKGSRETQKHLNGTHDVCNVPMYTAHTLVIMFCMWLVASGVNSRFVRDPDAKTTHVRRLGVAGCQKARFTKGSGDGVTRLTCFDTSSHFGT